VSAGVIELLTIPPLPPDRGQASTRSVELRPRYDDITQDGRFQLASLMPGLGAVWRSASEHASASGWASGDILPILQRLVIVAGDPGPFSVGMRLESSGAWRLARETDGDRIFLDMWLETRAPIGGTYDPKPAPDAPKALVGRLYASHVFTRPFAPQGERRVTQLDTPDGVVPIPPEDRHPYADAAALTAGATLELVGDHVFTMSETDSNHHVNSLVYPRLFEAAVVSHAASPKLLAQALEVRYRKPCFVGEKTAIALRWDGAVAVGHFAPPGGATKPNVSVAMLLA
jgi:hypothetical protein